MALEQYVLAILTGICFGAIVAWLGSSGKRLALMLVLLYVFQTGAQQVYRVITDLGTSDELLTVTASRSAFAIAAVLTLVVLNRVRRR